MKSSYFKLPIKLAITTFFIALLSGCGGGSSDPHHETADILPDGNWLIFIDASSPKLFSYDTNSESYLDLNAQAAASNDTAVQNLSVTDSASIGSFLHWLDNGNDKILLMKPGYNRGESIDASKFLFLAHPHGNKLAAHASSEFENPAEGSKKQKGLARLNSYVTQQAELFTKVNAALQAEAPGETLCQAYVDLHEDASSPLMHLALTQSGKVYDFSEVDGTLKASSSGFSKLTGVSHIQDCAKSSIVRVNKDGVFIFVADTQKLYLIDRHGGDFHLHASWNISQFMPDGFRADFMTAVSNGKSVHGHH